MQWQFVFSPPFCLSGNVKKEIARDCVTPFIRGLLCQRALVSYPRYIILSLVLHKAITVAGHTFLLCAYVKLQPIVEQVFLWAWALSDIT